MQQPNRLDHYRLLGRSGLRVSPLALGSMTFGADWGWGADETESRRIFDAYVERGGNFIDTASNYTNGSSETLVGKFAQGRRERLVLATKYSLLTQPGNPNACGNHRKNMRQSVERSLRRMGTDYIDLLYLHVWEGRTPVAEILRSFDDLVSSGKVLYVGISDTPAWQVARMQVISELRGWAPLVALQIEYSLVQRTVERELIPMASELGLGVLPWSPLAGGVLAGKYSRSDLSANPTAVPSGSRKEVALAHGMLTERALEIAELVKRIASEKGHSPSQVALAWTLQNPAITAPIIGARTLQQLEDNLGALDVHFSEAELRALDQVSSIELGFPHDLFRLELVKQVLSGGMHIAA